MADATAVTRQTQGGSVRGVRADGVDVFHSIPFGAPPTDDLRFREPVPHPGWSGILDCTQAGSSPPQLPSRLEAIMGVYPHRQDEDCLRLTVSTPSVEGGPRPVLVWIHGGGYMSGSGAWPCYDGAQLALRGDLVVVSINYRVGAFGFAHLSDLLGEEYGSGNVGLLDQRLALEWVHDNIAAFSGDPENVTVMGQSAGGGSIAAHLAASSAPRFRRAILLSPALMPAMARTEANRIATRFLAELDEVRPGAGSSPRSASTDEILQAQQAVMFAEMRAAAQRPGDRWDIVPPFVPVIDDQGLTQSPIDVLEQGRGHDVELLLGFTSDEMLGFHALRADLDAVDAEEVARTAEVMLGPAGMQVVHDLELEHDDWSPARVLRELLSARFTDPCLRLAHAETTRGRPAYVYRFDWTPPAGQGFGGTHCVDLPFVFGNYAAWADAPMLGGVGPEEFERVARPLQEALIGFVRTGVPYQAGALEWPAYDYDLGAVMSFGLVPTTLEKLHPRT